MSASVAIRGARVIDPASGFDRVCDLLVADGRVAALATGPAGDGADTEIDARGLVACPGLVDLRVRLREPGEEHKATIESETRAAVAAGITTVCVPPDTDPVVDTPAVVELIRHRAAACATARVEVIGALTRGLDGASLAELGALASAGCVGASNGLRPMADTEVQRRAFAYAANFGLTVFVHAEDAALARGGVMHEGAVATRMGLAGIPAIAESIAVARDLQLAEDTGARVHFCHLSTRAAVRLVAAAQAAGLPVSADASVHHLHLTDEDVLGFNAYCHFRPPLREAADREALRAGLAEGSIGALCSDHEPHEVDAKLAPFAATAPGASALETLLPLGLALVGEGVLRLPELLARLTCAPADIAGLAGRGRLVVGEVADLCVFDPHAQWTVEAETLVSRGHNSPFLGRRLRGRVRHTLVGGRLVYTNPGPEA